MEEVRVAAVHRPPRRWPLVVAGIVFVLVLAASGLARFFLDLLWFREVGKTQVFWGCWEPRSNPGPVHENLCPAWRSMRPVGTCRIAAAALAIGLAPTNARRSPPSEGRA
jgi:hypothetical protein